MPVFYFNKEHEEKKCIQIRMKNKKKKNRMTLKILSPSKNNHLRDSYKQKQNYDRATPHTTRKLSIVSNNVESSSRSNIERIIGL
jgi:hypothetical protein